MFPFIWLRLFCIFHGLNEWKPDLPSGVVFYLIKNMTVLLNSNEVALYLFFNELHKLQIPILSYSLIGVTVTDNDLSSCKYKKPC